MEEEEGALGVWATYLLAGVGGSIASYLSAPHTHTVSLGASGAVFGLFAVAIFTKFKPSLKKLLEFCILGQVGWLRLLLAWLGLGWPGGPGWAGSGLGQVVDGSSGLPGEGCKGALSGVLSRDGSALARRSAGRSSGMSLGREGSPGLK